MIISIRYRHLSPPASLDEQIENSLLPLGECCRLDAAEVLIEYRSEPSPAYLARVKVAVAGPDLTVEAADYTPENAYRRAVREIDHKLRIRKARRTRQRINRRNPALNFRMGQRNR
jgi:hypothetical protein